MRKITASEITNYIEANIPSFHARRLEKLSALNLRKVLKGKNPYLFKAKNVTTAAEFVTTVLSAYLSSQEEGTFGTFLEGLAVFVCEKVHGGRKSSAQGIDLEFEHGGIIYIVTVKSGPKWGNSRSIPQMRKDFTTAKKVLGTNTSKKNIVAVNGCCYGREPNSDHGDYLKLCGQEFWTFISGNENFYTDIIEPIGHKARERNEEFAIEYGKVINRFTKDFLDSFCTEDGAILWDKIVRFNSGSKVPDSKSKDKPKA